MSILENAKINFDQAIMYRTVSNHISEDELKDYDMLVFFSPAGIKSLLESVPNMEQGDRFIASFGSTTAQAVHDAGLRLDLEAPSPGVPSMTMALDNFLKEIKKNGRK